MKKQGNKFWSKYYKIRYGTKITKDRTNTEINFIQKVIPLKKTSQILDFSCGYGRHAIALAKLGYHVDGFDIDKESIAKALKQVKLEKIDNINLWIDNSTSFLSQKKYDLTICMYTSIGYLIEESNTKVFSNLFSSTKSKGYIILDLMNKNWAINNCIPFKEKIVVYKNCIYKISHYRNFLQNPFRENNRITFTNQTTKKTSVVTYTLQLYDFNEILKIIKINNHRIIATYGNYDGTQLNDTLERFIIVAQKNNY